MKPDKSKNRFTRGAIRLFLFALAFLCAHPCRADLAATFNSPTDVPVTANGYTASGTFSATLNFAPPVGTTLMVVKNVGADFINGGFTNLVHGEVITLQNGGINFRFVTNFHGGTGNDLVLQWEPSRLVGWGGNESRQLGDDTRINQLLAVDVISAGVLAGEKIIATSAGRYHSLAVSSTGKVFAWGSNNSGALGEGTGTDYRVPIAVNTEGALAGKVVVSVATGWNHSLALCADGTLVAWGYNSDGQLGINSTVSSNVPVLVSRTGALANRKVVAIAAGLFHSMALCADGTVAAWGSNGQSGNFGQLGNGGPSSSLIPVAVNTSGALAGKVVVAIAAGDNHSIALCSDGTVASWGHNAYGQLGNNSTTNSLVPVTVSTSGALAGKTVEYIKAGGNHNLALCTDGTIASWGYNAGGALGNKTVVNSSIPSAVNQSELLLGKTIKSIAAGYAHSLAYCSDGTIAAWGANFYGQLGNNSIQASSTPIAVSNSSLGIGECYMSALSSDSTGYHSLSLAAVPPSPKMSVPAAVEIKRDSVVLRGAVNPNGNTTNVTFEYGLTTTYGSTVIAALESSDATSPQEVNAPISNLLPGKIYHFRLTATNAFGTTFSKDGVFATSTSVTATFHSSNEVPRTVEWFSASGETVQLALAYAPETGTNLTVIENTGLAFINGNFNNLSQGQLLTLTFEGINYSFIANYHGGSGNDLVLEWALTHPVAWGYNAFGQLGDGSAVDRLALAKTNFSGTLLGKSVISQAAGDNHSLSVLADGTVAAYGSNSYGQLGTGENVESSLEPVPVDISGALAGKKVVSATAGWLHSAVVCADGKVFAWGHNSDGQLGNGNKNSSRRPVPVEATGVLAGKSVVAVSAGGWHTLALCADGTLAAWGMNSFGQLGGNFGSLSTVPVAVRTDGALAGKTVIAIAAWQFGNLVLCSDGTVASWGSMNGEVPRTLSTLGALAGKQVVSIAAGDRHFIALCSDNTVVTWGQNDRGQLGDGTTNDRTTPVAVNSTGYLSGKQVVAISAGRKHSMARCADGSVAAWGENSNGQLGNDSVASSTVPIEVQKSHMSGTALISKASSGSMAKHSVGAMASAITPEVELVGTTNFSSSTATVTGTVNPKGNAGSVFFEYGVDTTYGNTAGVTLVPADGLVAQSVSANLAGLTGGTTYHFRLTITNATGTVNTTDGIFTTATDRNLTLNSSSVAPLVDNRISEGSKVFVTLGFAPQAGSILPIMNNGGTGFIEGKFSNLAQGQSVTLSYNGIDYPFVANYYGGTGNDLVLQWARTRAVAWGSNLVGQIGDNTTTERLVPVFVDSTGGLAVDSTGGLAGKTLLSVKAGGSHGLALCSDGTIFQWGQGKTAPTAVSASGALAGKTVVALAGGLSHSALLCSDGKVMAWGANSSGQLGNNTIYFTASPAAVVTTGALASKSVIAIAAGGYHTLALCSDGSLVTWGENENGQLGNNSTTDSLVPVAVNMTGVLAGKTVIAIASGISYNLVQCSDGTLAAWGGTTNSKVPVTVDTSGVLAGKSVSTFAVGGSHNLALCSDGTLVSWGNGISGQLGNGSFETSLVPVAVDTSGVLAGRTVVGISAGSYHSLVVCSDGAVVSFGLNTFGQLGNNSKTASPVPVLVDSAILPMGERFIPSSFTKMGGSFNLVLISSPPKPTVVTLAATNVTENSATLNCAINPLGNSSTASFSLAWGNSFSPGNPSTPINGSATMLVSRNWSRLLPSTTYRYTARATNVGGTAIGEEMTFTTLPDTLAPTDGRMTVTPTGTATLNVAFASWSDPTGPVTYAILVDDVPVAPQEAVANREIAAPTSPGVHTIKGRIYDGLGHMTEVTQLFTANTGTPESWRMLHFGTEQNTGDAADLADPDGDGADNFFEYVAGLNPTTRESQFKVDVQALTTPSRQAVITFGPVVAGRTYTVKYKTSLTSESWAELPSSTTTDNGANRTVTTTIPANGQRFYRVEIGLP